jgi:hypothetical protein
MRHAALTHMIFGRKLELPFSMLAMLRTAPSSRTSNMDDWTPSYMAVVDIQAKVYYVD